MKSDNSSPAILFRDSEKLDPTIKLSHTLPTTYNVVGVWKTHTQMHPQHISACRQVHFPTIPQESLNPANSMITIPEEAKVAAESFFTEDSAISRKSRRHN